MQPQAAVWPRYPLLSDSLPPALAAAQCEVPTEPPANSSLQLRLRGLAAAAAVRLTHAFMMAGALRATPKTAHTLGALTACTSAVSRSMQAIPAASELRATTFRSPGGIVRG